MPDKVHEGYFSIDKNKRQVNPESKLVKDEETGLKTAISDDVDAYDLILKKKGTVALFGGTRQIYFFAFSTARRVGQSECLCHLYAQAQR